jgi:hypothetical protein
MLKERGFKPMHLHLDRNDTRDFDDGNKHEVCKRSADCEKPIIDAVKKGIFFHTYMEYLHFSPRMPILTKSSG